MNTFSKIWDDVFTTEDALRHIEEEKKEIVGEPKNLEEQAISLVGRIIGMYIIIYKCDHFYNRNEIVYSGLGFIDYVFIPHYKSNYHKAYLIDEIVDTCKKENIKYKALKDGRLE